MIKLIHGDSLEVMKKFRDNYFDLIFADLPFSYYLDEEGKKIKDKEKVIEFMKQIFEESYRILKEGGNFVVLDNPSNLFRYIPYLQQFKFRNGVPLIKSHAFYPAYHLGFKHNYLLFLYKDNPKKWYKGVKNHHKEEDDTFSKAKIIYKNHCNFHSESIPLELCKYILELTTKEEDKVLDVFSGSGQMLIASYLLNRHCIGIEKEDLYYKEALKRIERYTKQKRLF